MAASNAAPLKEVVVERFLHLSNSLTWDSLQSQTKANLKMELLDYFGGALAAAKLIGVPDWVRALVALGGHGQASVFGATPTSAQLAALCNGYLGHVLEMDDTHDKAVLHAGSASIPAVMAAAQMKGALTGAQFCEAVLLGIDLTCRLALGTRLNLVEGGWIYGALLGHFGATIAAGRVAGCTDQQMRNALGIAYCLVCGNHQSTREGATTKHVQPGFAAHNAILAVIMSKAGLDGIQNPFTGEDGLGRVYLHGQFEPDIVIDQLGKRYEVDYLSYKPYPTCRFTHPAISAALRMHNLLDAQQRKKAKFLLEMSPQAHDIVARETSDRLNPQRRMGAQFSVHWGVAVALAYGKVTPGHLVTEVPPSSQIQSYIGRIQSVVAKDASSRDIGGCVLRAQGEFGERRLDEPNAKGHPDNPMSPDELRSKFASNVELAGLSGEKIGALADEILAIDQMDDVVPFLSKLAWVG